jgi:hypothetical protein
VLTHIIPAASFTAATTAPALSALDLLDFAGRHLVGITATAVALVVLLVAWSFRKDHHEHRSIVAARTAWSLTGEPQGWAPGWAWSGFKADPDDDDAEDQAAEDEVPEAVCASCHQNAATVTVSVAGGPTFHLCASCSPVATVLGRAS